MDSIVQKFYSTGKNSNQNFTNFRVFSSGMIPNNLSSRYKISTPIKPITNINNYLPPIQAYERPTSNIKLKQNNNNYLYPKHLIFNSSSDMLFKDPFKYYNKGELKYMKDKELFEKTKNQTKIQMMEEKMKNLEQKSKKLEIINDFFFDMFENNLIQQKLQNQKINKINQIKEESSSSYSSSDEEEKVPYNLNNNKIEKKIKYFLDAKKFQNQTKNDASLVLSNIKQNLGNYLVEEELQKNEKIQSLNENINELKSDLINKLDKIQSNQKQQIQKIAYCLMLSGDDKVEELAERLFNGDIPNQNNKINLQNKNKYMNNLYGERKPSYKLKKSASTGNYFYY